MLSILISPSILQKLQTKHDVSEREVHQCFDNKCGMYVEEIRTEHKTDPSTLWFLADTNKGRTLKICFIYKDGNIHLKTAFEPDEVDRRLYEKFGQ